MSIVEQAKTELIAANFGEEDSRVMIEILEKFFDQWNSGGAVSVAAPVLQRLIAGEPLTPLTGAADEWWNPMSDGDMLQNVRCSSVFREKDGTAYDIALPGRHPITFPYWPDKAEVSSPVLEASFP